MPHPVDVVGHPDQAGTLPLAAGERSAGALERARPARSLTARLQAWRQERREGGPVDVSVCIVNWNCREMLQGCLESLLDQPQGVRLEVTVVDNASTDGAPDMVDRDFPEVVLIRNRRNLGFAQGNNQAARNAEGRFLFFLNNDTVLPPGTLRGLVDYADSHPDIGIVGPRLRDGDGRLQVSYRLRPTLGTLLHRTSILRWTGLLKRAYRRYRREDLDFETTRQVDVLMGAAMLVPRAVFLDCGGWDPDFTFGGEDLDLSTRIGKKYSVVYHPEVEILHYGRVSSRRHIGYASSNMAIGFVRFLRKCGYSRPVVFLYKLVVTLDAPIQLVGKGMQFLLRRTRGHRHKAEKSRLSFHGLVHFLTRGLWQFWRA